MAEKVSAFTVMLANKNGARIAICKPKIRQALREVAGLGLANVVSFAVLRADMIVISMNVSS